MAKKYGKSGLEKHEEEHYSELRDRGIGASEAFEIIEDRKAM